MDLETCVASITLYIACMTPCRLTSSTTGNTESSGRLARVPCGVTLCIACATQSPACGTCLTHTTHDHPALQAVHKLPGMPPTCHTAALYGSVLSCCRTRVLHSHLLCTSLHLPMLPCCTTLSHPFRTTAAHLACCHAAILNCTPCCHPARLPLPAIGPVLTHCTGHVAPGAMHCTFPQPVNTGPPALPPQTYIYIYYPASPQD